MTDLLEKYPLSSILDRLGDDNSVWVTAQGRLSSEIHRTRFKRVGLVWG